MHVRGRYRCGCGGMKGLGGGVGKGGKDRAPGEKGGELDGVARAVGWHGVRGGISMRVQALDVRREGKFRRKSGASGEGNGGV